MSFLDDDEDTFSKPSDAGAAGAVATPTQEQIRVRRMIAAGGGVVLVILLLLGIRGCLDARKESAIKGYVNSSGELVQESNQISKEFFGTLNAPGKLTALDFESDVKSSRSGADGVLDRANRLDVPDEMKRAQRYFVDALELRRDGLKSIADLVGTALGQEGRRAAIEKIAAQMQAFLASDVLYSQRSIPAMQAALGKESITGVRIRRSQFLPDIEWLTATRVGDALSGVRGSRANSTATPGLHGMGLVQSTLGGTALTAGGTATVQAGSKPEIAVQIQNQGESEETDVIVRVSVGSNISVEKTVSTVAQGAAADVTIPISPAPPKNRPLKVKVEVEPVPGEKKTDNNSSEYTVTFG